MNKKDQFYAKIAFYLSLGFWIPLFNIAISITSIILSILALKRYYNDPKKYGGLKYIIIALILSITSIVMTIIGLIVFLLSDDICGSAVCQAYLSGQQ